LSRGDVADRPVLALLVSSVDSNIDTCLQIMRSPIDLAAVRAPTSAVEHAEPQRGADRSDPRPAVG
jgi:hypothetical protein